MTRKMQNTHWYRDGDGYGWTSNPSHAWPSEVTRVGLHDCETQNCEEIHGGNAQEYHRVLILTQWVRDGFY